MKQVSFKITVQELTLLAELASDQLFRREFIDPKMPGYKTNPGEVELGKQLVCRMRLVAERERQARALKTRAGACRSANSKRRGALPGVH